MAFTISWLSATHCLSILSRKGLNDLVKVAHETSSANRVEWVLLRNILSLMVPTTTESSYWCSCISCLVDRRSIGLLPLRVCVWKLGTKDHGKVFSQYTGGYALQTNANTVASFGWYCFWLGWVPWMFSDSFGSSDVFFCSFCMQFQMSCNLCCETVRSHLPHFCHMCVIAKDWRV